jgi:UDP-hydrolysing UDP-N-acetyl-D-glucosamine 2-epimerase
MLAAATAGVYLQIPVIQLHAGEHSGSVDDPVRHAITQLASVHLCTTQQYAKEVKRMCPNALHVHTVGAPALDTILSTDFISKEDLFARFGFDTGKKTALLLQHPDTTNPLTAAEQLQPTLAALEHFDGNVLIIGSNADAGGVQMNTILKEFADNRDHCHFEISLIHTEFLSCENAVDVLVGNSSSGIIEAASFNLPVVNIGSRQEGRLRSGNVLDVPYDAIAIEAGIKEALDSTKTYTNIYGDGTAAARILDVLTAL